LQESRAKHEKVLTSASVRENELQASLEISSKQLREVAAKERDRATSLENENKACASELIETKRKANALLSKQCDELSTLRNGMQQKQMELANAKSECAALQARVAGLVAEKDQALKDLAKVRRDGEASEKLRKELEAEQARLQQQFSDLKRSNANLAQEVMSKKIDSSAELIYAGAERRRADASNFKNTQQVPENRSADRNLLLIRIEALQNHNKSLESDKANLVEEISKLQKSKGPRSLGATPGPSSVVELQALEDGEGVRGT
jgi:hypothetical protein